MLNNVFKVKLTLWSALFIFQPTVKKLVKDVDKSFLKSFKQ